MFAHSAFTTRLGSSTSAEARKKVVQLYRSALREVDDIIRNYNLDITASEMRATIRAQFQKHKDVTDPQVIDLLVFKGATELEEAKLVWKTKSHVIRFFTPERAGRSLPEMKRIVAKKEQELAARKIPSPETPSSSQIPNMFSADPQSTSTL